MNRAARRGVTAPPAIMPPRPVVSVHRSPAAIQRACACGGSCPRCASPLPVSAPGDASETEADRVARQVMGSGHSRVPQPASRGIARLAQRQTHSAGLVDASDVDVVSSAPGKPLDRGARAFFEPRFGHDFGHVRIHDGPDAAASAHALGAKAYTLGPHIVFGAHRYDHGTEDGRRLLAHELTHVVQQDSGASVIQRELIFGSGFKNPHADDAAETRTAEKGAWYPSKDDFSAAATRSGGGKGIKTFEGLLDEIKGRSAGSIKELGLVGHAGTGAFGLGGEVKVNPPGVTIFNDAAIDATTVTDNIKKIEPLRDRFADDAVITLYGCHAGLWPGMLETISDAFQVCVRGFSDEIIMCITWSTPDRTITSRGRSYIDTLGLWAAGSMNCVDFNDDIRKLSPTLAAGCPKKEEKAR